LQPSAEPGVFVTASRFTGGKAKPARSTSWRMVQHCWAFITEYDPGAVQMGSRFSFAPRRLPGSPVADLIGRNPTLFVPTAHQSLQGKPFRAQVKPAGADYLDYK
jgi:hypothetical protein